MDYNIKKIYEDMELELIASMKRNLQRHLNEEKKVGFKFTQWQAEKLKELKRYQKQNEKIIKKKTKGLNKDVSKHLQRELKKGSLSALKQYNKLHKNKLNADRLFNKSFFQTNDRKVNNLIKVVSDDLNVVNASALRMMNDQYREVIHRSTFFNANGVMTEKQAVDMANKDFLTRGLNCIEYKDGRRVNIASYSQMAVRTASLRAHLMGEGDFRKEIGNPLVIVTTHGGACKLCTRWQGKVLIDDVYSGGTEKDGDYTLLSDAMEQGFLHPNCRHGLSTYYLELEGIKYDEEETDEEIDDALRDKLNYYDRQEQSNIRKSKGFIDDGNVRLAKKEILACEKEKEKLILKVEPAYDDITKSWLGLTPKEPVGVKMYNKNDTFNYKNKKYKFDGHYIKYSFDEGEDTFADWLSKLTNKKIVLIPKIEYPQGIKCADFRIGSAYYDLKTIHGKDKQIIYHKIYGKEEQAHRFIFDIANDSPLTLDDLIDQANELFNSNNDDRKWVEMIGIRHKDKFVMLKRK